jgi:hypothetical protein
MPRNRSQESIRIEPVLTCRAFVPRSQDNLDVADCDREID